MCFLRRLGSSADHLARRSPRGPLAVRSLALPTLALVLAGGVVSGAGAAPLATQRVTNPGDSGPGTLRQAILDANASVGGDRIEFGMHLCEPSCVIRPTIALPPLTGHGIVIDGFSQAGARPPSADAPAVIRIEIDGSAVESQNGLSLVSGRNTVQGLAIHGFGWNGIAIAGPEATINRVWGNHIGLDASGVGPASRRPNGFDGVFIGLGAQHNLIGGDLLTERNVISGNRWDGVGVHGDGTSNNWVQGNLIGLDATGAAAAGNTLDGLRFYGGAGTLFLGVRDALGQRNVIAGNGRDGVRAVGAETSGLHMAGNLVGTDITGFRALANGGDGLHVLDGAGNVQLGTAPVPSLGLISGNAGHGIHLEAAGSAMIRGHVLGADASGRAPLPNEDGLRAVDTPGLTLGGDEPGQGNLISGNRGAGVRLTGSGTRDAELQGNRIGTTIDGLAQLPNGGDGLRIEGAAGGNRVGRGSADGASGNLISSNDGSGVEIDGAGTDGNWVQGNRIGLDAAGERALGNGGAGVYVRGGAADSQIGGAGALQGNQIAANAVGVVLQGAGRGNQVFFNRIGLGADRTRTDLGNLIAGVLIEDGTQQARLEANEVAYNGQVGVRIQGEPTLGNQLFHNSIHDNFGLGIHVTNGAHRRIAPPELTGYDPAGPEVWGRSCPGCVVQLFSDAEDEGAQPLLAFELGAEGLFRAILPEAPAHAFLTAVQTDPEAGSSAFSNPLPAEASTATPSPSPTRTPRPSPSPTSTATPTASVTSEATITPTATETRQPSASPSASPTRRPTSTPTPEPTPRPTASATPSLEPPRPPSATATLEPTPTQPSPTPEGGRIWLPFLQRGAGAS